MACYLVSYDLIKNKDYNNLIKAIKAYPSWCRVLLSVWIIKSPGPATSIRDNLVKHIDYDDKLLVVKLSSEAAWIHLSDEISNWLKANL